MGHLLCHKNYIGKRGYVDLFWKERRLAPRKNPPQLALSLSNTDRTGDGQFQRKIRALPPRVTTEPKRGIELKSEEKGGGDTRKKPAVTEGGYPRR